MRVLHVYRTYYPDSPGGLQEAIRQICLSTSALGVESRIFTLSPNPYPEISQSGEAQIIRSKSWVAPASCDIGGIDSILKFSNAAKWADLIHYHFPWPFADILNLAARPIAPAVMTYHSDIVRQKFLLRLYSPLMRMMLNRISTVVATSPDYLETSPTLCNLPKHRVEVIPLGIDERKFPKEGDAAILLRLGIEVEMPFFLFIGVLRYYKGLHTLVRAAKKVAARIIIVGSGPEESNLKKLATDLGVGNVAFAGRVSDSEKITLLKCCTCVVLPSHLRSEAFGMVLIEAAMFGKPMISCEIGTGTSFVNINNLTGLCVIPENPDELANAMSIILNNAKLANRFGCEARNRYVGLFSGEALGDAYRNLYFKTIFG